ncbi:hypothetical protein HPC49_39830 [Pyxidicoccus fallax]|uniref:Type 4 fimbrial biogenesis protein PilX N-terminal domain-containing protein n=1 Tax=Pyxidicoccus fallax TaxID=394095 RepID=A0A848LCU8_9BACT|nr:hypothetical protein [Pyxidicoccus fallax]NMO16052.1 hypothetical protein [Pyxidicoccus fallax]NPC84349.1 hypothetical protein [Pyxidicoccus fallax]
MNRRPPSLKRALARPPARRRGARGARPERGLALLMSVVLIALITAATLISLRAVSTESALQAHERRGREAFFAAQAGLAEGREVIRQRLAGGAPSFTALLGNTGPAADVNAVVASGPWSELIPWRQYTLATAGVDIAVAAAELNAPDGTLITDFPTANNVRYRVFLADDNDSDARTNDSNSQVWLVSVGEVTGPAGTQPHRSIVRMLITAGQSAGAGPPVHEAGGESN